MAVKRINTKEGVTAKEKKEGVTAKEKKRKKERVTAKNASNRNQFNRDR